MTDSVEIPTTNSTFSTTTSSIKCRQVVALTTTTRSCNTSAKPAVLTFPVADSCRSCLELAVVKTPRLLPLEFRSYLSVQRYRPKYFWFPHSHCYLRLSIINLQICSRNFYMTVVVLGIKLFPVFIVTFHITIFGIDRNVIYSSRLRTPSSSFLRSKA